MSSLEFLGTHFRQMTRAFDLLRGAPVESPSPSPSPSVAQAPPESPTQAKQMPSKDRKKSKSKPRDKDKDKEPPSTPGKASKPAQPQRRPSSVVNSPTSSSAASHRSESTSGQTPDSPQTTIPSTASSPVRTTKELADGARETDKEELLCAGLAWHRVFGPEKTLAIYPVKDGEGEAPKPKQSRCEFMASLYLSVVRSEELVAMFGALFYAYGNGTLDLAALKLPRTLDEDHYAVRKLKRLEFLGSHADAARAELFGDQASDDELVLAYLRRLYLGRPPKDDMWELKIIVSAHLWSAFNDKCHGLSKDLLEVLTKLDMEFDAQRDEIEVDWAGIQTTLAWMRSSERYDQERRTASSSSTATKPVTTSPFSNAFSPGFLKRGMSAKPATASAKDLPDDLPQVSPPGHPWRLVGPPNPHRPVYCREISLDHDMGIDAPPIEGLQPPPPPEILAAPGHSAMFSMPTGWAILGMEKVNARGDVGRVTIAPSHGVTKDSTGLFSVSGSFALGEYHCPCRVCKGLERGGKAEQPAPDTKTQAASTKNDKKDKKAAAKAAAASVAKSGATSRSATSKTKSKPAATSPDSGSLPSAVSDAGKAIITEALRLPTGNALFDDPVRQSVGAAMLKMAMDSLNLLPDRDIWPLVPSPILDDEPSLRVGVYQVLNVLLGGSVDRGIKDRCVETLEKIAQRLKSLSLSQQTALQRLRSKASFELAKHPILKVKRGDGSDATCSAACLRNKLLLSANDERERRSVYSMLQAGLCGALGSDHMLRKPLRGPAIIDLTCLDYSLVAWKPFRERAPGQGSFERGVRASPLAFRRYDPRKGWQRSWEPFEPHGSWPGTGWIRVYLEDVLDAPANAIDDNWEAAFKWVPERYFLRHVKPGSSADRWLGGFEENPALEELFGEGGNAHRWPTFDGAEVATLGGIIRDVEDKERGHAAMKSDDEKKGKQPQKNGEKSRRAEAAKPSVLVVDAPPKSEKGGSERAAPKSPHEPPTQATVTEETVAPAKNAKPPLDANSDPPAATPSSPAERAAPQPKPAPTPVKPSVCTKPGCTCGRNKDTKRKGRTAKDAAAKQKEPKLKGREIDEPEPERKTKRKGKEMVYLEFDVQDGPSSGVRHPPQLITWPPTLCRCGGVHDDGKRKCQSRPLTVSQLLEKEAKLERARREAKETRRELERRNPPPPPIMTPAAASEHLLKLRDELALLLDGKELPLDRNPDTKCYVGTGLWLLDSLITLCRSHSAVVQNMRDEAGGKAFETLELKLEEAWSEELTEGISRCLELVAFARDFIPSRRSSAEDAAHAVFARWIQPVALAFATRQSRAGTDFAELLGEWDAVTDADDAESRIAAMVDLTQRGHLHRLAERLDALAVKVKPEMARNPHEVRTVMLLLSGGLKMLYRVTEVLKQLPADVVLTKTQYRRWARKGRGGVAIPEEESDEEDEEEEEEAFAPSAAPPQQQSQQVPRSASGKKQEKLHKRRSAGRCRMPLVKSPRDV